MVRIFWGLSQFSRAPTGHRPGTDAKRWSALVGENGMSLRRRFRAARHDRLSTPRRHARFHPSLDGVSASTTSTAANGLIMVKKGFHRRAAPVHLRLDAGVNGLGQDGVDLGPVLVDVDRRLVVRHGRHAGRAAKPRQLGRAELVGHHAEGEHVEPMVGRPGGGPVRGPCSWACPCDCPAA